MGAERQPDKEQIRRGQIFFLAHPDTEIFSGYGLTVEPNRKDYLVGLLMVDRPRPVPPAWLAQVEALYGDYELTAMTATGERGIVAQMRIEPESLPYLQSVAHPLAREIARTLQPLLDALPAPVLKLAWNEEEKLWQSEFWIGLPPALQAVFERTGYGCLAVERGDQAVSFVTHAPDADIERFRGAPVRWHWELVEMPTAPLIRFRAAILDTPAHPYIFEHFLNVEDRDQAHCLSRLVQQDEICFDFFGTDYEYRASKYLPQDEEMRAGLQRIVERAIEYYGDIPAGRRDFDRAKAEFQSSYPI